MNRTSMKKAFSMIELIFTIVILGITFMTLPIILNTTNKSIETAMESKVFYHGLAKMQIITDKPWDENNTADFENTGGIYYVLQTQQDVGAVLECDANGTRSGHYEGLNRRMCTRENGSASTVLGADGAEVSPNFDDIDDFDGAPADAVDTYSLTNTVEYVAYDPSPVNNFTQLYISNDANQSTSVKRVQVNVSDGADTITDYYYYATNVGRPQAFIKDNP